MFGKGKKNSKKNQNPTSQVSYDAVRKVSTRPRAVEKQVNLKAMKGEEVDLWIMRIAWLYAYKKVSDEDMKTILEENHKNNPVNVMMDETLFLEGAHFVFMYSDTSLEDDPDLMPYFDWVEESEREKKAHSYPVVRFYIEETEVDVTLDGAFEDEDGEAAVNFAKGFWLLADEFTDYKLSSGKRAYTLEYKDHLPKDNKMDEVVLGLNENGAWSIIAYDLSNAKLQAMPEEERRVLLIGTKARLEAALVDVTGVIRNELGLQGEDEPKEDGQMSVLDYIVKISETWDSESSRVALQKRIQQGRDANKSDAEIVEEFKLAKRYERTIANIEQALANGKDPLAKIKKNNPKPKKNDSKPDPKNNNPSGDGNEEDDDNDDGPDTRVYEPEAACRTNDEWMIYFYKENDFHKLVKKGFFDALKPEGSNVPRYSAFTMAAHFKAETGEVPAYVDQAIKDEVIRIENKRKNAGA